MLLPPTAADPAAARTFSRSGEASDRFVSSRPTPAAPRLALFIPSLAGGGAERVMLTLAKGFCQRGHSVDLIVVRAEGPLLNEVPPGVRLIDLGSPRVLSSVFRLARYLKRERPATLLATITNANAAAVIARWLSGQPTRVVIRQAYHLTRGLEIENFTRLEVTLERLLVRWCYPRADLIIAVSKGVAADLQTRSYMRRAAIRVAPNPVVTNELRPLADAQADHPWFRAGEPPVIIGVGRLNVAKQFDVLIRAFAQLRRRTDARLMILGEGEERQTLEQLVQQLGVADAVSLPGFVSNPFPAMAKARVFVLSSAFEGLPGVLIQALACGTTVVATDCDSGPREVLQGGRFGRLVPVGDVDALADAIDAALADPVGCSEDAWLPYTESRSVDAYLHLLSPLSN
jgi:glycosyltransferase involved in cell wall biosynthesis